MKDTLLSSKFIFLIFSSIIFQYNLHSQQDSISIEKRILEAPESEQLVIMRTRSFIFNNLKEGNIAEAFEAYNYALTKFESEKVKPFKMMEKYLLCFWFGEYDLIYETGVKETIIEPRFRDFYFDDFLNYNLRDKLTPLDDIMSVELRLLSNRNRTDIINRIDSLVFDNEKHDYLILFFDRFTFDETDSVMTYKQRQDYLENDLTPRAEKFLAKYKNSQFENFVRQNFRFVYALNDWGYGFQLGLGALIPQGTIGGYFKTEATLGIAFDISWKKLLFDIGFDIGIPSRPKRPFFYDEKNWLTEIKYNYYNFNLNTGFVAIENKLFKISPHLGIGVVNISVCEDDKNKTDDDLSMSQGIIQLGITSDFKRDLSGSQFEEDITSYLGFSLTLDYSQFLGNNPIMSDGMFRIRLSLIGFGRAILRVL